MKRSVALTIAGIGIGVVVGSSMGVAAFGGAINAAWVFGPLGGFVGWLVSGRFDAVPIAKDEQTSSNDHRALTDLSQERSHPVAALLNSALVLLAYVWNFHIAALDALGILDTFVRQPLLFVGLGFVASFLFPPFLVAYFVCWLAASHFKATKETRYLADIP